MSDIRFDDSGTLQQPSVEDFVAVMFASSRAEAELCRQVLEQNGIPARLEGMGRRRSRAAGISVLISESRLEAASDLLAANTLTSRLFSGDDLLMEDGPRDDDDEFEDDDDDFDDDKDDDEDDDDLLDDDDDDYDDDFDDDDDDEEAGGEEA